MSNRHSSGASRVWRQLPGKSVGVSWVPHSFQQLVLLRVLRLQRLLPSLRLAAEPGPVPFASLLGLLAEYTEQDKHTPGGVLPAPACPMETRLFLYSGAYNPSKKKKKATQHLSALTFMPAGHFEHCAGGPGMQSLSVTTAGHGQSREDMLCEGLQLGLAVYLC